MAPDSWWHCSLRHHADQMRAAAVQAWFSDPPILIAVRLSPSIFIDNLGEWYSANWPESSQGIPNWQKRIRVHVGRQAKSSFDLHLEIQVQRRESRAETERSRRQQHVLDCRINRGTGRAGRCAAHTGHDPYRS